MPEDDDAGVSGVVLVLLLIAVLGFAVFTQFGDSIRMMFKYNCEMAMSDPTTTIITQSISPVNRKMDDSF